MHSPGTELPPEITFEKGSNSNGRWMRWLDKYGSPIFVLQYNPTYVSRGDNGYTYFPIAFPDNGAIAEHTTTGDHASGYSTITSTYARFRNRDSFGAYKTATSTWWAVWVKV